MKNANLFVIALKRSLVFSPDTSSVFLSANSFINPFEHLSEEETRHTVQSYIAFLKDDTRLIKNPGLKVCV